MPVATVESKLCVPALMNCRSDLKDQWSLAFHDRLHEMSCVSETRLATRVSAPKLMPPSVASRSVPVSRAPFLSYVAPGSMVMLYGLDCAKIAFSFHFMSYFDLKNVSADSTLSFFHCSAA